MTATLSFQHLTGSRQGQAESFELAPGRELTFGRDPSCDIRYAKNDDLVSRRHLKVLLTDGPAPALLVEDLGSSNGTFVNNRRLSGPLKLNSGDVVRLGASGPEARVEVRFAAEQSKVTVAEPPPAPVAPPAATPPPSPEATEVRTAAPMPKQRGRRVLPLVAGLSAAALVVLGAGVAFYLYAERVQDIVKLWARTGRTAPALVPAPEPRLADSVVLVERRWNLVDADSGRPLYQLLAPNRSKSRDSALVAGAGDLLPVFVLLNGKMEPVLTTSDGGGKNLPIAGLSRSSGFVAAPGGTILTTQNGAPGSNRQSWPEPAGMLLVADNSLRISQRAALVARLFPKWEPASAAAPVDGELGSDGVRLKGRLRGRMAVVSDVALGGDLVHATPLAGSEESGLASIRVPAGHPAAPLELSEDPAMGKPGDPVTVLGYPAGMEIEQAQRSKARPVPATIARAAGGGSGLDRFELASRPAAVYPGAPVLDRSGKVIGILQSDGSRWFAIPSRYAADVVRAAR